MTKPEQLKDQKARDAFCNQIDANFSVIAPAGVGKTTAIVRRIITICKEAPERLPQLVVVTYTNKAAQEMKLRARRELMRHDLGPKVAQLFGEAFFGTIHSYCSSLIKRHGAALGVSSSFELLTNQNALWENFREHVEYLAADALAEAPKELFRLLRFERILDLAKQLDLDAPQPRPSTVCPPINLDTLWEFAPSNRNTERVSSLKESIKAWHEAWESGKGMAELPHIKTGGKDFIECWHEAIYPLTQWLSTASYALAYALSKAYQGYRIRRASLNYDDLIDLAAQLVASPKTRAKLIEENATVILDEAQDTDARQFSVLLGVSGYTQETPELAPGRYCMVGDPQQAIYSSRADVSRYVSLHRDLSEGGQLEELTFEVTMRCDRAVVSGANKVFPNVLSERDRGPQVDFVPLQARPWAGEGALQKLELDGLGDLKGKPVDELANIEADELAGWLSQPGTLQQFGITRLSDIAILAPRKQWLVPIKNSLERLNIPAQLHSTDQTLRHSDGFAWTLSPLVCAADLDNPFEIYGLLRDLFGFSDDALARYSMWWDREPATRKDLPHPLSLLHKEFSDNPIGQTLAFVKDIFEKSAELPLQQRVTHILEALDIEGRLRALNSSHINAVEDTIAEAAEAELAGTRFEDFVAKLRLASHNSQEDSEVDPSAIQLITCHKAKGLEWKVVILPYLFRPIRFATEIYPRIAKHPTKDLRICWQEHPSHLPWDAHRNDGRQAELERLFYVAITRAREQLVLVDDSKVYTKSTLSAAELMKLASARALNREAWEEIPRWSLTTKPQADSILSSQAEKNISIAPSAELIADARALAYPKRQTVSPSQLAKKHDAFHGEDTPDGLAYGNWWHHALEHGPWSSDDEDWVRHIEVVIKSCPNAERGRRELMLLQQTTLWQELNTMPLKTELPIFFALDPATVVDGFVDLVAQESNGSLVVVDWKTDLVESADTLARAYNPQIAVYIEALKRAYEKPVTGYIYATYLGEWAAD